MQWRIYYIIILNDETDNINVYVGEEDGKLHFVDKDGADTVLNFNSTSSAIEFNDIPFYYTAAALNSTYTAYHQYFVIPRDKLKSISFDFKGTYYNDRAENDVTAYNLACIFIGSVISLEQLEQNGIIFIMAGRDAGNHKVKIVLNKSGSYSFDDFSDCLEYVTFGTGQWNNTYFRYHIENITIKLK